MDVVVHVLASNGWIGTGSVFALNTVVCRLELGLLGGKSVLDLTWVVVLEVAVLNTNKVMVVLFWENFPVMHWLDGCVVVILMGLLVDRCCYSILLCARSSLVGDCWSDLLLNCSIVRTILMDEVLDGLLG